MNSIIYNDTMINTSISFSFYNFLDKFLKKLVDWSNFEERYIYILYISDFLKWNEYREMINKARLLVNYGGEQQALLVSREREREDA